MVDIAISDSRIIENILRISERGQDSLKDVMVAFIELLRRAIQLLRLQNTVARFRHHSIRPRVSIDTDGQSCFAFSAFKSVRHDVSNVMYAFLGTSAGGLPDAEKKQVVAFRLSNSLPQGVSGSLD